eukprot:5956860-Prymnesium_polylepis.2
MELSSTHFGSSSQLGQDAPFHLRQPGSTAHLYLPRRSIVVEVDASLLCRIPFVKSAGQLEKLYQEPSVVCPLARPLSKCRPCHRGAIWEIHAYPATGATKRLGYTGSSSSSTSMASGSSSSSAGGDRSGDAGMGLWGGVHISGGAGVHISGGAGGIGTTGAARRSEGRAHLSGHQRHARPRSPRSLCEVRGVRVVDAPREPVVVEEFAHAVLVLPEGLGALPDVVANDSGGVVVEM